MTRLQRNNKAQAVRLGFSLPIYNIVLSTRTEERRKRNMEVLSIHVGLYPDGAPLEDTIPAHDPIMQQLEMDLLLHELAGRVSKQQMDIVHLKQGGYGLREIARTQKVPMRRIKELLAEVHDVLLDICYG